MRTKTRFLSILLALALVLSLLLVTALADTTDENTDETDSTNVGEPQDPSTGSGEVDCNGEEGCSAKVHDKDCISLCTQDNECPNTLGVEEVHQSGCPKAKIVLTLEDPTVEVTQKGQDIIVSYGISSDPAVDSFLSSECFNSVKIELFADGESAPMASKLLDMESIALRTCTFNSEDVHIEDQAGSSDSLNVSVKVTFDYKEEFKIGEKTYKIEGDDTLVIAEGTCTFYKKVVENPGVPDHESIESGYNLGTFTLSWNIKWEYNGKKYDQYQGGVKPDSDPDQHLNDHFTLAIKRGETVLEEADFYTGVNMTRSGNRFTISFRPTQALSVGDYTFVIRNKGFEDPSVDETITPVASTVDFTLRRQYNMPSTPREAMSQLLYHIGITKANTAFELREYILGTLPGSSKEAQVKNMVTLLRNDDAVTEDLMNHVYETEKKFLEVNGLSVKRTRDADLGGIRLTSVIGLGLNSAVSKEIVLRASTPKQELADHPRIRKSWKFSLSTTGLSDNEHLKFPMRVGISVPEGFAFGDPFAILHYDSSGTPENLGGYLKGNTIYFATDYLGDFALVHWDPQPGNFDDVPAKHSFHDEISWVSQKGIMNGTGNGRFTPDGNVNRQQLWMVLARMAGANPVNMEEARTWAIDNGISDGSAPGNTVSRQQLVTMLYRYAVKQGISVSGAADLGAYSDSGNVAGYAKDAMAWAVGNGIISGTSGGGLNPKGSATRAHFAAFLYRFGQKTGM